MSSRGKKAFAIAFLAVMLVLTYLPIAVLAAFSFTESKTLGTWNGFSLGLYAKLFSDGEIMTALKNTLIVALASSALAVLLGVTAAIGIFHLRKVPRALMEGANQITVVNADIVTAVGFMLLFLSLKDLPDELSLVVAHTVICAPYVVMSVMPRLAQLDPNAYEAGLDLGARPARAIVTVMLPRLLPGIIAGFMLAFTVSLDDFAIATLVGGGVTTIPRYLYNKLKNRGVMPALRALSVVILALVALVMALISALTSKTSKKNAASEICGRFERE